MASMKDFLEKMALKVGSRGAMPSGGIIQYGVNEWVAPCDGYVVAGSISGATGDAIAARGPIFQSISRAPEANASQEVYVQCRKGEKVSVFFSAASQITKRFFVKSVGGGLKSLIYKLFPEVCHAYA